MIYWVKTQPQADIDHSEYKPFIRNDWFRNHYMFFAYGLMALLTVLFFATGAVKAIRSLLRLPVFVLVFLVHESLHMLVVYRIGDIYLSHSGLFFWMQPHARMSKGRFFLFMTLPLFMLTVVPAVLLLPDTGALRPYLLYIAWSNAIIASSDIINAVLIPLKPNDSVFYRGYYKTGSGAAEKNVSGEPSPCHIETRCADKAENVSGEPSPCHTAVIFVRHAQAVYGSDDRNRPLSEAGMEDRKIVAEALKDRKIDAFLSSPYRRSMETIRPAMKMIRTIIDRKRIFFSIKSKLAFGNAVGIPAGNLSGAGPVGKIILAFPVSENYILYLSLAVRNADSDYSGAYGRELYVSSTIILDCIAENILTACRFSK